jgi:hypothetical protein
MSALVSLQAFRRSEGEVDVPRPCRPGEEGARLTISQSSEPQRDRHRITDHVKLLKPRKQLPHRILNQRLQTSDFRFGEERIQCTPSEAMKVMANRRKRRLGDAELTTEPRPLVSFVRGSSVDDIVEVRVCNVHFFGVDPDYRPVLLMQLLDLERVLSLAMDVVVKLIPVRSAGVAVGGNHHSPVSEFG